MTKEEPTFTVDIFIAGDLGDAKRICREQCMLKGLCVTVTATEFIYTGGAESGVRVGLVNYPRFPSSPEQLWGEARRVGDALQSGLCQWSYLIVAGDKTLWITNRPEGS